MTCIDDDLYLMSVSKLQQLQNEYDELHKEHDMFFMKFKTKKKIIYI